VTVRPGDSLWAIAARGLPANASDAQIAAAVQAWHRVNHKVIGADPHLIFPAQRLIQPSGKDLT
jgi:nucleoid-associated protein YgaU